MFCSAIGAALAPTSRCGSSDCRLESARGAAAASRPAAASTAVRENRDDPHSKELRLHVAVIPALRLKPAGRSAVHPERRTRTGRQRFLSVASAPAFARIRRDRDIVLVDQRGTGRSNRLDCDVPGRSASSPCSIRRSCRQLVQRVPRALPGDPRYYTTSIAVRDLDDVRAALGYERVNLYGISYGTRVAQHYMRRYPERVRAAILDGVVPAEARARARRRDRSTARARCKSLRVAPAMPTCARAFPDIVRAVPGAAGATAARRR